MPGFVQRFLTIVDPWCKLVTTTEQHSEILHSPFWEIANVKTPAVPTDLRPDVEQIRNRVSWRRPPKVISGETAFDAIGAIADDIYTRFIVPSLAASSFEGYWTSNLEWQAVFANLFDAILATKVSPVYLIDLFANYIIRDKIPTIPQLAAAGAVREVESAAHTLRDAVSLVLALRTIPVPPENLDAAQDPAHRLGFSMGVRKILIALMALNVQDPAQTILPDTIWYMLQVLRDGAASVYHSAVGAFYSRIASDVWQFAERTKTLQYLETAVLTAQNAFGLIRFADIRMEINLGIEHILVTVDVDDQIDEAIQKICVFNAAWAQVVHLEQRDAIGLLCRGNRFKLQSRYVEEKRKNPWLDAFGADANDPQWEGYQEAIRRARTEDQT